MQRMTHLLFCRQLLFIVGLLLACNCLLAQDSTGVTQDTVVSSADTLRNTFPATAADTIASVPPVVKKAEPDTTLSFFNQLNPAVVVDGGLVYRLEKEFVPRQNDAMFYATGLLLLILGIVRMGFSKYYADMMRIFGQTTFRQKSLREQLLQNRLASLLMNLFFFLSAGFFVYQLGIYYSWTLPAIWWKQLLFCIAFVAVVYGVKYIGLQISGWLFGLRELADSYTFMVFLINKAVGVLLLPASVVLALGAANLKPVFVTITLAGLAGLFIYRYIIALPLLRQHVKVIPIHFFLYFCAFEIVPVLLVYKWTLSIIRS